LSASPKLWGSISAALDDSSFLILLASSDARGSHWVSKEVAHWVERNGTERLLIALTEGALAWDISENDFFWDEQTPLPVVLKRKFFSEPNWVDLRRFRTEAKVHNPIFLDAIANFAAATDGVPKERLLSDDRRRRRQLLTGAWGISFALLLFAGAAAWEWRVAVGQRDVAQQQRARAEKNYAAAKQTVKDLISNISQGLRFVPGMRTETVTRVLSGVNSTIGRLVAENPHDDDLTLSRCVMFDEFVKLYQTVGDLRSTRDLASTNVFTLRQLVLQNPRNENFKSNFILSLARIADVKTALGDQAGARASFQEAVNYWKAASPNMNSQNVDKAAGAAAMAYVRLGLIHYQKGDRNDARTDFEQAGKTIRGLKSPNAFDRVDLLMSQVGLLEIKVDDGYLRGAKIDLQTIASSVHNLTSLDPQNILFAALAAESLSEGANIADRLGDYSTAASVLHDAESAMQAAANSDSHNLMFQSVLSDVPRREIYLAIKQRDFQAAKNFGATQRSICCG
jgi:tetratricopeptide (TPR) repeat protein